MDTTSTYSNNSKNVCICTTISIILILVFVISPLNKYFIASFFGKVAALLILAYALYQNYNNTENLSKTTSTYLFRGEWSPIKTNILCGYTFSFFILLLFFSLLKNMLL
uniref:Uncharacterized protein n=1 Tax=viral metagenome TaxID=1070528 RepID=A0A6C0HE39_9ZZZZ